MTKDTLLKHACLESLEKLLAYFGTKAEMARKANMSRNAVSYWFSRGQLGRLAAVKFARIKALGVTKEDLRPDIKDWTPLKKRKKM
jgi:DNA-binding transcriptional regulator YdaS (Cro superfamily)